MSDQAPVHARRVDAARACQTEHELDALLVTHLPNIRYLTGFSGSNAWLVLTAEGGIFATDGRYEEQARDEVTSEVGFDIMIASDGMLPAVLQRMRDELHPGRVGAEGERLSYSQWQRLAEEADEVDWVATTEVIETLRLRKDPVEIAAIEKAVKIAETALTETLALVQIGMSEVEFAAELDLRMARLGSLTPPFETIAASGPRSALPHARSSQRLFQEGDFLLCDFGARFEGYCSDITRTFVIGQPSERQIEVYQAVLDAHESARATLVAGVAAASVDTAARDVFEAADLGGAFPHSTGHGVGLEIHEAPRLHARSEASLEADMVVTVEPGLYFEGWGGVRIEDDLVVAEGEPRSLVSLPKDRLQSVP